LSSLGAKPIPRKAFLKMLNQSLQNETLKGKWTDLA